MPKKLPVEELNCPVCKNLLGYRQKGEFASADCGECNINYTYRPEDKLPISNKPLCKKKTAVCGCPLHSEDN